MSFVVINMSKKTDIQLLDESTELTLKSYWQQIVEECRVKSLTEKLLNPDEKLIAMEEGKTCVSPPPETLPYPSKLI